MKRGQAALEFLMTYGWAILVVLVAIGALAYFGVLRPEKLLPEKCVIATGSGLYCDDYSAAGTNLTFRIKNMLADPVNVTAISVTLTGPTKTCTPFSGNTLIAVDDTATFSLVCPTASGDKIKGDFDITFAKAGGLSKTATGQLVTTAK